MVVEAGVRAEADEDDERGEVRSCKFPCQADAKDDTFVDGGTLDARCF